MSSDDPSTSDEERTVVSPAAPVLGNETASGRELGDETKTTTGLPSGADAADVPRTIGNYEILGKLGQGGMGVVYKARHVVMDRVVAIKVLPEAVVRDPLAVERFRREVKVAARLQHPNIVAAHDADRVGGLHLLVLEYVDGTDLAVRVKEQGPLQVAEALEYVADAAEGLAYAHGEGVVHRDIKPHNLMVDARGKLRILDMGLARLEQPDEADEELTGTHMAMGTAHFMAPEQARNAKYADARSDVYSLGCTLYWLLTGKGMYSGETMMELLLAHREEPVPDLPDTVPAAINAVCRRMVAKAPENRFQTMTEVVGALRAATTPSPHADTAEFAPPEKTKKSFPPGLYVGGGVGLLATALLCAVLFGGPRGDGSESGSTGPPPPGGPASEPRSETAAEAPPPALAPFDTDEAKAHQEAWAKHLGEPVVTTNSIGMPFTVIPPGEFVMGEGAENIVDVMLTRPFRLGVHEVTQGEWKAVMGGSEPWKGQENVVERDNVPATFVSWPDAVAFCRRLTERERSAGKLRDGWEYRLPTEAEWEYACRAGTTTPYWCGDEFELGDYAWFESNTTNAGEAYAHEVGARKPNPWGLFDVNGNVWEWCADRHGDALPGGTNPTGPVVGSDRVIRGGSWKYTAESMRSASRDRDNPSDWFDDLGFRVVLGPVGR